MGRTAAMLASVAIVLLTLSSCGQTGEEGQGGTTSANTTGGETTTFSSKTVAETTTSTLDLTPSHDSNVSGTATLTNTPDGGVDVVLQLQNLQDPSGTEHQAGIHQGGTCTDERAGNGASVKYSLSSVTVQDGTGTSTTEIPGARVEQLFLGTPRYVNVLAAQSGNETPQSIACANLRSSSEESTSGTTSQS